MVSVLHKELEHKVKKLKYKTLQPRIKNNFQFQLVNTVNHPGSVQMKFYRTFLGVVLISSMPYTRWWQNGCVNSLSFRFTRVKGAKMSE